MAEPHRQADILGNLAAETALHEVGVEIDHVEREGRVARGIGLAAAIFDEQLARPGAEPGVDTIEIALEQRADCGAAGEAVILALFAAGDHPDAPARARQPRKAADGVAVVGAAILAGEAHLRDEAGAVGELRLHQLGIDRAAQRGPLGHRRDPAGDVDPLDQDRRRVVQRRVHRVGAAGSEALAVDAAEHALAGQPAIAELARQRAVAEDVAPRDPRGDRGGIGGQRDLARRGHGIAGDGVTAPGGDDDGIGERVLAALRRGGVLGQRGAGDGKGASGKQACPDHAGGNHVEFVLFQGELAGRARPSPRPLGALAARRVTVRCSARAARAAAGAGRESRGRVARAAAQARPAG